MTQVSRGNRPGVALPIRIHELLLSLAGRLDDDALADARQMLASAELDRSLEFVAGCLAAGGVVLTGPQHRELEELFANTFLDPSVIDRVVVRDNAQTYRHRFAVGAVDGREPDRGVADAIRPVLDVLPDVRSVWCVWRLTPAGPVSGPVPHRLVLVGVGPGGFAPATAYRVEYALRRAGIRASVEVLVDGAQPTDYHQEAMRCARQVPFDDPGPGGGGGHPTMSPVEPVRAEPFAAEPSRAKSSGAHATTEPTPKPAPEPAAAEATSVLPVVTPQSAAEHASAAPGPAGSQGETFGKSAAQPDAPAAAAGPQGETFEKPPAAQPAMAAVPDAAAGEAFRQPADRSTAPQGEELAEPAGERGPARPFAAPADAGGSMASQGEELAEPAVADGSTAPQGDELARPFVAPVVADEVAGSQGEAVAESEVADAEEAKPPSPFGVEPPKIESVRSGPSSARRMKPVESIKSVFEQERAAEEDEPAQPPSALSVENPTNSRPSPRRRAGKAKDDPPSRPRLVPAEPPAPAPAPADKHSAAFVDDILNTQERNLLRELQDELARREKQDNPGPWRSGRHGKAGPMAVNGVPPHPDSRGYGSA